MFETVIIDHRVLLVFKSSKRSMCVRQSLVHVSPLEGDYLILNPTKKLTIWFAAVEAVADSSNAITDEQVFDILGVHSHTQTRYLGPL